MSVERIDRISGPPVLGRIYLVPTVAAKFFLKFAEWPVIGPEHRDIEFFNFRFSHYHIDARFLPLREAKFRVERSQTAFVLHAEVHLGVEVAPLPPIIWRKLRCNRPDLQFALPTDRFADTRPLGKLRQAFAGRQCQRNAGGFVCPHQNAPVGSISPIGGIITCPLHGLRIDAETGIVQP